MNCRYCGTTLPEGALFCGECGRAVEAPTFAPPPRATVPPAATLSFSSPGAVVEPDARAFPTIDSEHTCPQCGEEIDAGDVFCGECGFVVGMSAPRAEPAEESEPPLDPPSAVPVSMFAPPAAPRVEEPIVDSVVEPASEEAGLGDSSPHAEELERWAPVPPSTPAASEAPVREPDVPPPAASARRIPDPFPWGIDARAGTVDLEATRVVAGPPAEERFVLQFSTGESVTVTGAGLVGRNPSSQPGEFVDQLVAIFDAGKSVSKTHLEFGQEGGRFWVSDRYSTNGSTVRQPDAEPRRCEPGRRYFVARGTRVDIGEQFFVVS